MESFEALVAAHPQTTFVGAHLAGNAEDLAWLGSLLDRLPNLHVDISARVSDLGRQPRAARRFVEPTASGSCSAPTCSRRATMG